MFAGTFGISFFPTNFTNCTNYLVFRWQKSFRVIRVIRWRISIGYWLMPAASGFSANELH